MRLGTVKFENFIFIGLCSLPFTIFAENRMRLGIVKFENFIFTCLCSRLSLFL